MKTLPNANNKHLVTQDLGKELLIYHTVTNKAYTLNETSMIVFNACNGVTTFDELKHKYKYTDDLIYLSLDELKKNNLLEDYESSHFNGVSRREVVKRVGLATMIALPVISSLIAPSAAHAASGALLANGQSCGTASQCQNGICAGACCSGFYTNNIPCSTQSDCCFGGNGVIFCGTNAVGATNVCCSTNACAKTADCCAGEVCIFSGGVGSCG